MWVSFPLSRRSRVLVPWFIAAPLLPIAAGVWVVGLTVDLIRWVWRPRREPPHGGASVSIRVDS